MTAEKHGKRRSLKWVVLCAAVLVVGLIVLGINLRGEGPSGSGAEATSARSSSDGGAASDGGGSGDPNDPSVDDEPTEPPRDIAIDPQRPRPTESPEVAPAPADGAGPELEPVAPESVVQAPSGAMISLARIEAVHGEAKVGGEISGPAIRVSVAIRNEGSDPIDLEYVVVNAYSGQDRTPAAPIMQPGGEPFSGSLGSGGSADGIYLFSLDESARDDVVITVDYGVGEPIVVFRGDLT